MGIISGIKISNFKGVQKLDFEPKLINVIVGKNNSHKTSILEAVNLLYNYKAFPSYPYAVELINRTANSSSIKISEKDSTREIDVSADQAIVRTLLKEKLITSLKSEFGKIVPQTEMNGLAKKIDDLIEEYIRKEKEIKGVVITENQKKTLLMSFGFNRTSEWTTLESTITGIIFEMRKNNKISEKVDFISTVMGVFYNMFYLRKTENNKTNTIFMSDYKYPNANDQWSIPYRKEVEKKVHDLGLLKNFDRFDGDFIIYQGEKKFEPIAMNGNGFKTMYSILWKIAESKAKRLILLLDEPDRHMHMGYVKQLRKSIIQLAQDDNVQIFLTTHNRDMLEDILSDELPQKEKEFLEKNLTFLKVDSGISNDAQQLTYEEAKEIQNGLLFDLRGI